MISAAFWPFLGGAVAVHWLLPVRFRTWFLFVASAAWLTWLDSTIQPAHVPISVPAAVLFGVVFYVVMQRLPNRPAFLVPVLLAVALGYLAYFKYVPSLREALHGRIEDPRLQAAALLVPLGASYYTFKLVHYAIESNRKNIQPHGLDTFLAYLLFFPMFTAGPIERFDRFLENRSEKLTRHDVVLGVTRIMYGLVKKLVFVDLVLGRQLKHEPHGLVDAIPIWGPSIQPVEALLVALPNIHPLFVWQAVVTQFLTIYLDFSAYTDLAVGAGLLFGVRLMENFDYPIFATNISDFWRRWHISLSSFCQQYVYLPVIGLTRNPYLAIVFTMGAIGLWHEGSWNYLAWGLFHALFLIGYLSWGRFKRRKGWVVKGTFPAITGAITTFLFCSIAQVFVMTTRLPNGMRASMRLLAALFGGKIPPAGS